MINYIKYTLDGKSYSLIDNGDGTWSKETNAPNVAGNYSLIFEISEDGVVSYVDSTDIRYMVYLTVIENIERKVSLKDYIPEFLQDILEFSVIYDIEDPIMDKLYSNLEKVRNDMFITSASNDAISRLEKFLNIKGQGTLEQRKSYLISLLQKGKKLNEDKIKKLTNTITGSDCIVTFYGASELNNPEQGHGLINVQVLSPDNNKDYRYEDITRTLRNLVPGHIKLLVIKYYSTWSDVIENYDNWSAIRVAGNWRVIKDYIPPQ
ncbi:MAG: hypothetical protein K0R00_3356 [Herbinix sp.]|jgi:hypothetical protein|nr:hypothetical protein [Herbinix sp.]